MKAKIERLLKDNYLKHFSYFDNEPRLIYTSESGSSMHLDDYKRLIEMLNENKIKHESIGIDVVMLKED